MAMLASGDGRVSWIKGNKVGLLTEVAHDGIDDHEMGNDDARLLDGAEGFEYGFEPDSLGWAEVMDFFIE